ncbi:MAG: hypothetical protein KJO77_09095 [Bacteroidia bacterium]|nr:hypothetical protein [Bacteroidia bacterium]
MTKDTNSYDLVNWIFWIILILIGILNIILIHPVPGIFYLGVSLIYLPPANATLYNRYGFTIPFTLKVIVFVLIMWATLGVGDLMELFESKMR